MVIKQGLYLVAPHGRLVFDGDKKSIATGRKFPIIGERVICSKEDGKGLAFGIATIGEPATIDSDRFDDYFSVHRVPKSARLKWWADKQFLYNYPIQRFTPFPEPVEIEVTAGTIMDMGEVELPFDPSPAGENHLVIPASAGKIMSSSAEETMPWTASDATRFTKKADTPKKQRLWAATANSRLEQCKKDGGDTKECESSAVRVANAAVTREKQFEMEQLNEALVKAIADELERRGLKAGDDGEGDVGYCTCPNCKETFESDVSCSEAECPTCSGDAHAEDDKGANGEDEENAPDPVPMEKPPDAVKPPVIIGEEKEPETEEKAGRRFSGSILEKLRSVYDTLSDLIKHGEYADKKPEPDVVEAITSQITPVALGKGFKSLGTDSQGRTWYQIWPSNAYKDREEEFFATDAIADYTTREKSTPVKTDFWHIPGTEFGTVQIEAQVADHFVYQLGTYDNTPIGEAFKDFFEMHPDGHPDFAPEGWGASHQFRYDSKDRETGVFQVFDMEKSTVLPLSKAANIYNPKPVMGGFKMNDEQKAAIDAIGTDLNIPGLADQIVALGQNAKQKLDEAGVERKSIDDEQVPEVKAEKPPKDEDESQDEESEDEKPKESKKDVAEELANAVAERLGLHDLSNTISDILETQKSLQEQLASVNTTVDEVKQAKEEEVATALGAPRYVWQAFQASKAKETATTPDAQPVQGVPDTVKSIASHIGS